jgi:hypothetical protein
MFYYGTKKKKEKIKNTKVSGIPADGYHYCFSL